MNDCRTQCSFSIISTNVVTTTMRILCVAAMILLTMPRVRSAQEGSSTDKPVELIVNEAGGGSLSVSLSSDGRFFAVPNGNSIELWDILKARRIRTFSGPRTAIFTLTMSRDGKRVATGTSEIGKSEIYVWDVETGHVDSTLQLSAKQSYGSTQPYSSTSALAFSADGRRVIAAGSYNRRMLPHFNFATEAVRIIDISTGQLIKSIEVSGTSNAASIDLSPDGKLFAIGFYGGVVQVYDIDGKLVRIINSPTTSGEVKSLAFSPNGQLLAFVCNDYSKKGAAVEIWDFKQGRVSGSILGDNEGNSEVTYAWAPDGTKIATRDHAGLRLWDVRTGRLERQNASLGRGTMIRYKPDGSGIITSGSTMVLLDPTTLQPLRSFGETVGSLIPGTSANVDDFLVKVAPCKLYAVNVLTGSISKRFERDDTDELCPIGLTVSNDGLKSARSFIDQNERNAGKLILSELSSGASVRTLATNATGVRAAPFVAT